LQRIVEFLNTQMDPAEVLAVEVKQYAGQGLKTFVPRVLGQTVAASEKARGGSTGAAAGPQQRWDEDSFFADLTARRGPEAAQVAQALLDWAKARGLRLWWGRGKQDGSFFPILDHAGESYWTISVWTYGSLEIQFKMLATRASFADEAARRDLLERFRAVGMPGVTLPDDAIGRRPSMQLTALSDPAVRERFLGVLDSMIRQIQHGILVPEAGSTV
jgi:hypothetical protein